VLQVMLTLVPAALETSPKAVLLVCTPTTGPCETDLPTWTCTP
jgi:hypothetical protein